MRRCVCISISANEQHRQFTFIDVWREAAHKDLPGVTLHSLSILTAGWRVQPRSQGGVTMAVVKEAVLEGEKAGAT